MTILPFDFMDFLITVLAPHECIIRTGLPNTYVNAENEAWFYSKVTLLISTFVRHCFSKDAKHLI